MMVKKRRHAVLILVLTLLLVAVAGSGVVMAADVPEAGAILKEVAEKYKSMSSYRSHGTATMEMEIDGRPMKVTTEFTMALKKPDLYCITWTKSNDLMPTMEQSGAVWNDGTDRNLFVGIGPNNVCLKQKNDEMALASATGLSGGMAMTIPSLFFQKLKEQPNPTSSIKDPKLEGTEKVDGVECYVLGGSSAASKKETLWISKDRHLVVKYSCSLEPPSGKSQVPEITDEQLEKTLKQMGREVTEENKQQLRDMMDRARESMKNVEIKGTMTEVHIEITSPKLKKEDLRYELPEGTEFKDSLLDMAPGGSPL